MDIEARGGTIASMPTLPDVLRRALAGPLPGPDAQLRMAPRFEGAPPPRVADPDFRPAAALLLLYPFEDRWHVPLTGRGSRLRHHTGQVSLPGGRIEPGETPAEAAAREVHEETGLEVEIGDVVITALVGDGAFRVQDFAAWVVGGSLRAGDDADEVRWAEDTELTALPLTPGLLDELRRL